MALFDIFKKKKKEPIFPENDLEKNLMLASTKVSARNEFYKKLLQCDLYVLTSGHEDSEEGIRTLEKDTTVQFVTFEDGSIPLFTSTNRIFDKRVITEEVPYMAMSGQSLFELAIGAKFILNPYSDYGKELLPEEIKALLNGSIFENKNHKITIEKDTQVLIGQPANYPTEMVDALRGHFEQKPNISKAHLALIDEGGNNSQHLIVALEMTGKLSEVGDEAGPIAEIFLAEGEFIDFMQVDNGHFSDYFRTESTPFYSK